MAQNNEIGGISNINMVNTGESIKICPTWAAAMQILLAVLEDGTPEGKERARAELVEMGRRMDRFANEIRQLRPQVDPAEYRGADYGED